MDYELSIDLILTGLPHSFAHFVFNYIMKNITSTILELINTLKIVEPTLRNKGKAVILMDLVLRRRRSLLRLREVWPRRWPRR